MIVDELFDAIEQGDLLKVALGFQEHDKSIATYYAGYTPLTYAIFMDRFDVANFILDLDPDLTVTDSNGESALIMAIRSNEIDLTRKLLLKGANPNDKNRKDMPGLQAAINRYHHSADMCLELVKLVLEFGADVNGKDINDNTAILKAAESGFFDIVETLIEHGADLNIQNNKGYVPLMQAIQGEYLELASLFVELGANLDIADARGFTPLMLAVKIKSGKSLALIDELITHGANLDLGDTKGTTAVMMAAKHRHFAIVDYLLQQGANADVTNKHGETLASIMESNYQMELGR